MADAPIMNPDVTLDLTGVSCPGPIIGAKKIVSELAEGEVLLLISDCPATSEELHTWAERTGNSVVKSQRMTGGHTGYYLKRGRRHQIEPNVSLDMRGSVCPGPILEAKKVLDAMASGELLCLASNCPGSRQDVEGWARATGCTLEDVVEVGQHDWEFFIRKA
jgi:TusA-related sulfurtransferase